MLNEVKSAKQRPVETMTERLDAASPHESLDGLSVVLCVRFGAKGRVSPARLGRTFLSGICAGNLPVDKAIEKRVAADTVRTVDAARDFAGSVKTRHKVSLPVEHLRLDVARETAHRMVNGQPCVAGPERTVLELEICLAAID